MHPSRDTYEFIIYLSTLLLLFCFTIVIYIYVQVEWMAIKLSKACEPNFL